MAPSFGIVVARPGDTREQRMCRNQSGSIVGGLRFTLAERGLGEGARFIHSTQAQQRLRTYAMGKHKAWLVGINAGERGNRAVDFAECFFMLAGTIEHVGEG